MTTTTAIPEFVRHRAKFDPWGRNRDHDADVKAYAAKVNEEARENWDSPEWKRQVAADLREILDYGFINENLFPNYIQVRTVGETDRPVVEKRRGLKVFATSRGGYISESQMTDEVFEFPRATMGFHVSEHTDKLRAGFAKTIAELTDKGSAQLDAEVNRQILALAQAATPVGSAYHTAAVGMTKADLDEMIRGVREAIKPDGVGPVPVTILGRAAMVDMIGDFSGHSYQPVFADPALEEIRNRGYLGTYKGCNVIQIQNYVDDDDVEFMPAGELWVLGGTAGEFVFYGGSIVRFWDEDTVDYTHLRSRRDFGGLAFDPAQMRRISDSTVSGS